MKNAAPRPGHERGHAMAKNTICLWYDKEAEAAARFYAETFPDSAARLIFTSPVAPAASPVAPADSTGRRAGADRQLGCLGSPNCAEKTSRSRSRRRSQTRH